MLAMLIFCSILNLGFFGQAQAQTQAPPELSLHFSLAEWAFEIRDQGDYDPNPEGVFPRGERGYAYFELEGFGVEKQEDFYVLRLKVDVALKTAFGLKLYAYHDLLDLEQWYEEVPSTVWFYIWVDIPWWAPKGAYRTMITVRDQISGEVLEGEREIRVF